MIPRRGGPVLPPPANHRPVLDAIRQRNPKRSIPAILFYDFCHTVCWLMLLIFFRLRVWGQHNMPRTGPFIVAVNHQSHLDPMIAGMATRGRHLNFIARSTLFGNPLFGKLIGLLNSVPLNQKAPDTQAIRTCIEQLGMGRAVLIFPEGSRTKDGAMHPFKKGVWLLLSRAKCPVLPVAIEGAYDAWRRGESRPKLLGQRVSAMVGAPIAAETLLAMGHEQGLRHLRATIEGMRVQLAEKFEQAGHPLTTKPASDLDEPD